MSVASDPPADLVLRGGRIATMDAARRWVTALAVRDGRIVAVGSDARPGHAHRVVDAGDRTAWTDRHARVPGRPRPPRPRRPGPPPLRVARHARSGGLPRGHRRVRAEPSRRGLDPGRWLVHGRLPRRDAAARGSGHDRAGSSGPLEQPRRPWGVGQHARAGAGRDHGRDGRPGRRSDRARPRRLADRHAPRRGHRPGRAARAGRLPERSRGGPAPRPDLSALARDHGLAGRDHHAGDRGAGVRRARVTGRVDGARRRGDVVGACPRA